MSASELLTAWAELVSDSVVNDGCQPVPEKVLRYHGTMPHDCCSDAGFVVASWEQEYPSNSFPNPTSTSALPCDGPLVLPLVARYVICWPLPDVGPGGIRPVDSSWDAAAARLIDTADAVARRLLTLTCGDVSEEDDPIAWSFLQLTGGKAGFRYIGATPITPNGGCAGVQWRAYARSATATAVSS